MKLSNKILLGFFGFLLLYLTAVFAEIRLTGIHNIISDKNSIAETVDLSNIHYLVLNDLDRDINVIGGDRSQLEVRSFTGDLLKRLKYKISGDTLTLLNLQSEEVRTLRITVFLPKANLKGISVEASDVDIFGFQLAYLPISQKAGRVTISDCNISNIKMDLSKQSFLEINSSTRIDTVFAKITGSEAFISAPVAFVRGSVTNESHLQMNDIGEIQLKKDESSRLNMY